MSLENMIENQFDPQWYLRTYPDVARAGMDPWEHYCRHGRFEGRQPFRNRAEIYDYHLWRGLDGVMLPRLQRLLVDKPDVESDYARWALARWFAWCNDAAAVRDLLLPLLNYPFALPEHQGPYLLFLDACTDLQDWLRAEQCLNRLGSRFAGLFDMSLAECNLQLAVATHSSAFSSMNAGRLALLNGAYERTGLVAIQSDSDALDFDSLHTRNPSIHTSEKPLLSVVVPVFNAGSGLETALRGLHQQTWPNLEIIVVDDASSDASALLADRLCGELRGAGRDFRLLRHEQNAGAYAARNSGMAVARGEFLSVHDADDWSHPQKLEKQIESLLDHPELKGTVSHWVRADDQLRFGRWRVEAGWVYRNVSSLMIRRQVLEELGFWDEVAVNADTEYYYRIQAAWGAEVIGEVLVGVPLAFGRVNDGSLSQHRETHLVSQFAGVRKNYIDAAHRWHAKAQQTADLFVPCHASERPFLAPDRICRRKLPVKHGDERDVLQQSGEFDSVWYRLCYPDLQQIKLDAFEHWWRTGRREGRTASPLADKQELPGVAEHPNRPWVMVFAHQVGEHLFGAETSLLDVLAGWQALAVNVIVVVPELRNENYLAQLRGAAQSVVCLPGIWWQLGRPVVEVTVKRLQALMERVQPQLVYANTIVHYEPLIAARQAGIRSVAHIRELPEKDPALCDLLNASPTQVRVYGRSCADQVAVSSGFVARAYDVEPAAVLPNVIRTENFALPLPAGERPVIGMISSNLPKKGIDDFVALAEDLLARNVAAKCVLVGPENEHTHNLQTRPGGLPENLSIAGYADSPQAALGRLDMLLNLSHFEESFGRTVLEAMAAGRPVVCYRWGALPELVDDGRTGFLVEFGNVKAVANVVESLLADKTLRQRIGHAAQQQVEDNYSMKHLVAGLNCLLDRSKTSGPLF